MGPLSGHCEINITSITQDNFDLFIDIISFQHVLHFNVGRSEIEWNMKVIGASVSEPHLGSSTRRLSVYKPICNLYSTLSRD